MLTPISILGAVLPLLSNSIQRWTSSNNEHKQQTRSCLTAPFNPEASIDWTSVILCLLCSIRPAVQLAHVQTKPTYLDEQDSYWRGNNWHVSDCHGLRLELLVSLHVYCTSIYRVLTKLPVCSACS